MKLFRFSCLLSCLLSFSAVLRADVRLPHLLSDHAVLQRDRPIHIWGWATPGAHLTAHFHAQTVPAQTDALGAWSLWLSPEPAGGPFTLTISGDGADLTLFDLLVGDVWFASGQSNMEMPLGGFPGSAVLKDADKEIAAATNPKLRLLLVDHKASDYPVNDIPDTWTICTPETAKAFSAVAYFFGREIAEKENVPVGLIDSTWGGAPADSWVSMDTLGTHPDLLPAFASRSHFADEQTSLKAQIAAEKAESDTLCSCHLLVQFRSCCPLPSHRPVSQADAHPRLPTRQKAYRAASRRRSGKSGPVSTPCPQSSLRPAASSSGTL